MSGPSPMLVTATAQDGVRDGRALAEFRGPSASGSGCGGIAHVSLLPPALAIGGHGRTVVGDGVTGAAPGDETRPGRAPVFMTDTSADPAAFTQASTEWIKSHLDRMDHRDLPGDRDRGVDVEPAAPTAAARRPW